MAENQQHTDALQEIQEGTTVIQALPQTPVPQSDRPISAAVSASSAMGGHMLAILMAVLAIIVLIWALSRTPAEPTNELYEPTNTTIEVPVEPIDDEPEAFETMDDTDTPAEPQPPFGDY